MATLGLSNRLGGQLQEKGCMALATNGQPGRKDVPRARLGRRQKEAQALLAEIAEVEANRKALMEQYLHGPRKQREQRKTELDRVRQHQHQLRLRHAQLQVECVALEVALGLATEDRLEEARQDHNRLRSLLPHEEWLVWTRSIWKFKDTESTARTGKHPAQFSAVLPRRLIKMFSYVGETVLDPFVGLGTTLCEAWTLERHSIGVDINPQYVKETRARVEAGFREDTATRSEELPEGFRPAVHLGDARALPFVKDDSIQLIVTHPPYWNAVRISNLADDLSACDNDSYQTFLAHMETAFREMWRVLEPDRVCCVVTGDVMRKVKGVSQLFPLHADYILLARRLGFTLWDTYIWETKIRDSGGRPMMGSYPFPHKIFSQFAHNYILVFRKSTPQ
jgi:DNA modification methylase